jgi:hypothetical protein
LGHYKNIYLQYSLDGGGKEVWEKGFDVRKSNKMMNDHLNWMEIWLRSPLVEEETKWTMVKKLGKGAELIIDATGKLPENTCKKQKNYYKENKIMESVMGAICDDVKEAREVKKEANEIIKEIARKAESPWETEYFEDKNDPWEYKIGYCTMENGVCVECRCWPYKGFAIDWI